MKTRILVGLLVVVMGAGCVPMERSSTLQQEQREKVAQSSQAELVQATKPVPTRVTTTNKDGTQTVVETPPAAETRASTKNEENSDSAAKGSAAWAESIPMFVKLIGMAVGGAMVLALVWFVVHKSKAAAAAWAWMNDALAEKINALRAMKGASTDPVRIQALSDAEAQMEHLRAEANK